MIGLTAAVYCCF